MKLSEARGYARKELENGGIENPGWEAGALLALVLQKDIGYIYAHPELPLQDEAAGRFKSFVKKRRGGMPFQYISNSQEFMSLDFYVNNACLIPRPETEILVEYALQWLKQKSCEEFRILDIGTGSGAIAVSIATYAKDVSVDALDISREAIQTAQCNAKRHHVDDRIRFIQTDFFQWSSTCTYSLILSNPPYIPRNELDNLMAGVREYEPEIALDGGEDGLLFYRAMVSRISKLLETGGAVFVETGKGQAVSVRDMFQKKGLVTYVYPDLAGIDRVVRGDRI